MNVDMRLLDVYEYVCMTMLNLVVCPKLSCMHRLEWLMISISVHLCIYISQYSSTYTWSSGEIIEECVNVLAVLHEIASLDQQSVGCVK